MAGPEFIAQLVAAFLGSWIASRSTFRSIVLKVNELCHYVEELRRELGHHKPAPEPLPEPDARSHA